MHRCWETRRISKLSWHGRYRVPPTEDPAAWGPLTQRQGHIDVPSTWNVLECSPLLGSMYSTVSHPQTYGARVLSWSTTFHLQGKRRCSLGQGSQGPRCCTKQCLQVPLGSWGIPREGGEAMWVRKEKGSLGRLKRRDRGEGKWRKSGKWYRRSECLQRSWLGTHEQAAWASPGARKRQKCREN